MIQNLKKIYKQEGLDVGELFPIDKYNFTDEELQIINCFKSALTSNKFIIVGFEGEYTKILS